LHRGAVRGERAVRRRAERGCHAGAAPCRAGQLVQGARRRLGRRGRPARSGETMNAMKAAACLRTAGLRALGATLLLALSIASCAYVDARTTQYVGVPRFPPTDPASVQVLRGEPRERHDRLGEVFLDISVDPPPPVEDIERKLREAAARWG